MAKRRFRTFSQFKKLTSKSKLSKIASREKGGISKLRSRNPSLKFGRTGMRLRSIEDNRPSLSTKEKRQQGLIGRRTGPSRPNQPFSQPQAGARAITGQEDLDRDRRRRGGVEEYEPSKPVYSQEAFDRFLEERQGRPAQVQRPIMVDNLGNEIPITSLTGGGYRKRIIGEGVRPETLGYTGPRAPSRLHIRQGTPSAAALFDEFGNMVEPASRPAAGISQPLSTQDIYARAKGATPRQQAQLLELGLTREKAPGTYQVRRAEHGYMIGDYIDPATGEPAILAAGQTSPTGPLINVGVRGGDPGAYLRVTTGPNGLTIGEREIGGGEGYPYLTTPKQERTFVDEPGAGTGGGGGGGGGGGRTRPLPYGTLRKFRRGGGGGGSRGFSQGGPVRRQQGLEAAQERYTPFRGSRTRPPTMPTAGSVTRRRQNQLAEQGIVSWRI